MQLEEKDTKANTIMSTTEFAELGADTIGYMRPVTPIELQALYPEVDTANLDEFSDNAELWMLVAANGVLLAIGDNADLLAQSAIDGNLHPVSLH